MYAIAVVQVELETVSIAILFLFVLPLAFSLSTFLLWIMYGLQSELCSLSQPNPFLTQSILFI
jgi:hypothetical protein